MGFLTCAKQDFFPAESSSNPSVEERSTTKSLASPASISIEFTSRFISPNELEVELFRNRLKIIEFCVLKIELSGF